MKIHQFVHTLNYGDAISGEAIALTNVLRELGHESIIYSVHAHEKVKSLRRDSRRFDEETKGQSDVAVLHHYSIASPLNDLFAARSDIRRGLIYHNLTPEHWFESYNARVTADLQRGRRELPALLRLSDVVLADSEYNREELLEMGCSNVAVLPLVLDEAKWTMAANAGIAGILKGHGGRNILHVGRIAPNKRIEDILKAFYFYHHKIDRQSRLWLIGNDIDTEIYSFELRRLVSELRLKEAVTFVGAVSDDELKAFYENCDLYLCMSEHEGFCVPLIEAMHFSLPVIAYKSCAVGATVGNAGILLDKKEPAFIAELMAHVLGDESLRQQLKNSGRQRVQDFSLAAFRSKVQSLVLDAFSNVQNLSQARYAQ